jgi:hypothetical protein
MTPNSRLDNTIGAWLQEGPTSLDAAERRAIADASEQVEQRRTGFPMRFPARGRLVGLAAAAAILVVAASALLPALARLPLFGGPVPVETDSRTPAPDTSAVPTPDGTPLICESAAPRPEVEWTGRIRTNLGGMPSCGADRQPVIRGGDWPDPRDTTIAGIDIVDISNSSDSYRRWGLELAGYPPGAADRDTGQIVIEYGLVFETTGDDVPDYLIGINTDAPVAGDYRVWVTNLGTGLTDERFEPPYGFPIDFAFPDPLLAPTLGGPPAQMRFFFLDSAPWTGSNGPGRDGYPIRYYAWASATKDGEVMGWDYAPNDGWLVTY